MMGRWCGRRPRRRRRLTKALVLEIMELIARAPWREAVTYRDTWPHEYVVVEKDGQQELLAAFHHRVSLGEGVECSFFHRTQKYLFLGEYKYWALRGDDDVILNRALLYKDRRDFVIREGDTGKRGVTVDENVDPDETELTDDQSVSAASGPEGRIERLDIGEIWEDEPGGFTPWLAENLDILGEELGMDLELVEQERLVGSFRLDILAKDGNDGTRVVIENQFKWTDHSHLGQLLTYTAGCDARAAVWIAPEFRYEHRKTIDRLNQWTGDNVKFYGVEVKVIKIGDSSPAPDFRVVAAPDDWGW